VSWRGVVSAVEMYASAKHSPLLVFTVPEIPKLQELACSATTGLDGLGSFPLSLPDASMAAFGII
jgi:hypothetical protein